MNNTTSSTSDREIVISRVMNAPQALVFDAWTKPEHLANWWGPNGFSITTQDADIKAGGHWKFIMHGPDGVDYPTDVVYHEVTPITKLRYSVSGIDHPEHLNFTTTVTFEEIGTGKTKVTMTGLFQTKEALEFVIRVHGAKKGGEETIGKLAEYVESIG
jgi:uncharacterized protein YndB with AHSA1/START domain